MEKFKRLDLPIFPSLEVELQYLLASNKIYWNKNQICINTTEENHDDFTFGTGSLEIDWDNSSYHIDSFNSISLDIKKRSAVIQETDFTEMCSQFENTSFQKIHDILKKEFSIGRLRLMLLEPRQCMSWHHDQSMRIHYPIKTSESCFMIIENQVLHLPKNTWWLTNTLNKHTALNSSTQSRIHLVASVVSF